MTTGSFSLEPTTMAALPFSNSIGLRSEFHRHHDLTGGVGFPPGPDGLLLRDGLPLAVDLGPALGGPDVVEIFQELILLLQLGGRSWRA